MKGLKQKQSGMGELHGEERLAGPSTAHSVTRKTVAAKFFQKFF
jgi:hypothetical protein